MRRIAWGLGTLAVIGVVASAGRGVAVPVETGTILSTRALAAQLKPGRAGEAVVSYRTTDLAGAARTVRGRLRVEPPDRVRVDFTTTGESIALRGDGGEWLQPASKQLIRIPAARAAEAMQWWRVVMPWRAAEFREEAMADGRYRLEPAHGEASPIAMRLDARGFPSEIVVEGMSDTPTMYHLSGWKFGPARGAAAYRLRAPAGYETVELP
jgi:hypothetical protein